MCATRRGNALANKMNRPQPSYQDQRRYVDPAQENERADFAHRIEQQSFSKKITDPPSRTGDVEMLPPAEEMTGLQLQEAGAGCDEQNDPRNAPRHAQTRIK